MYDNYFEDRIGAFQNEIQENYKRSLDYDTRVKERLKDLKTNVGKGI